MRRDEPRAFVTRDQAAAAPVEVRPAWTPPAGTLAAVTIMLTPFAPLCEDMALTDDRRWRTLCWKTPAFVVRAALARLQRRADQVVLRVIEGVAGVEVHDRAEAPPVDCARLLAIIFDVPAEAVRAAHAALLPTAQVINLSDRRAA